MRSKTYTYIRIKPLFFPQNNLGLLKHFMLEGTSGYHLVQHPAQRRANFKVRSNTRFRPGCAGSYIQLSGEHLQGWNFYSLPGPQFRSTTLTVTPSICSGFFLLQFVFIITNTKHTWASAKNPKVLVLKETTVSCRKFKPMKYLST